MKKFLKTLVLLFLLCVVLLALPPVRRQVEQRLYPRKYNDLVEQYAAEYDLDPLLVYSFIRTESGFDPGATSSVDARGLMQMTEETFLWLRSKLGLGEEVSFGNLYDPDVSIRLMLLPPPLPGALQRRYLHGRRSLPQRVGHCGCPASEGGTFRGRVDPVGFPL